MGHSNVLQSTHITRAPRHAMLRLLYRFIGAHRQTTQVSPALLRDALKRKDFATARRILIRLQKQSNSADGLALEGEALFHEKQDHAAERAFRRALAEDPGHPDANYGLSLLLEDPIVAARHAQFAVNRNSTDPRYHAQLGYLHLKLGNPQAAEKALNTATKLDPFEPHAWNNLGIVMRARGDGKAARHCFECALKARPDHPQALENLAELQHDPTVQASISSSDDSTPEADGLDALELAWTDHPYDAAIAEQLTRAYVSQDDFDSAANVIEQALERMPEHRRLQGEQGVILAKRRQYKTAIGRLSAALEQFPNDRDYLLHLAVCHNELSEHTRALPFIERALDLTPDSLEIQTKKLACLTNLCRYEEALALSQSLEARGINTDCTGLIHIFLGQNEQAEAWLSQRLSVLPNDPGLRFQRAQLRLSQLNFEEGWDDYAYRMLSDASGLRVLPFPLWKGESLEGKRIIVLAEQGLGDQIMFASCIRDLLDMRPAQVIVEAIDRIAPTLQRSFPECRVIPTRQDKALQWIKDCGPVDCYVPLADLPRHFRRSLDAFPKSGAYLAADPARATHWNDLLPPKSGQRLRIGVSWRGGTEGTRTFVRSVDPAWLGKLSRAIDADWICLQYGDVSEELPRARSSGLTNLFYAPESISNLDEFAALITTLDLVITVCNTTVHYAGALGAPVWILSPHVPEWRYGLDNEVLPWYPSSRMFRQGPDGDWDKTLSRVALALTERASTPK